MTYAHRAYRLLARLLVLPLLAWLWWRGRREPGYRQRLRHRLGDIPTDPQKFGGIWIHAASVGEVQALQPLLQRLLLSWPAHAVVVSTQTPSGAQALQRQWGDRIQHVFAPLDTPGAVTRFLNRLQPQLLILMERELWPEWMHQCRLRGIPVALVNARLTERSARAYERWKGLMRPVWPQLTVAAADASSAQRLQALGVKPEHLRVTGNLKFDVEAPATSPGPLPGLHHRKLVVAGSTHPEDEEAWLSAWSTLAPQHADWLLVLVPRHPQRFEDVSRRLQHSGLVHVCRSKGDKVEPSTNVLLVDVMGELLHWYRQAAVCFVGGTLAPVGGHNPLEPLSVGQPVLFGPHTDNAAALFEEIEGAGAGRRVRDAHELSSALQDWMLQRDTWQNGANAAHALMERNRGATDKTLNCLEPVWQGSHPLRLCAVHEVQHPHRAVWVNRDYMPDVSANTFDQARQLSGHALATGSGRGQALLVQQGKHTVVLRHYRRGGLVARLSEDRFWRTSPHQSRAMREFSLLRLMRAWDLPVPEPVAASYRAAGFFYQADIMVGFIPGSSNLVQRLQKNPLHADEWQAVGRAIRQIHDRQVFHSDLNAHNLLLDGSAQAWVVDFDKCGVRPGDTWKQHNLDRLLRSLHKESARVAPFYWHEADWPLLLAGYSSQR